MLRSASGRQEEVFERMGPHTVVALGEQVRVKFPGWLYIPGTVVTNTKGNDDIAVKFSGLDVKYYPRDSSISFQRHWNVEFERVTLATKFKAGERVRVVMPDGESFEGNIDYVSRKPEISHSLSMTRLDGSTEARTLKRDSSIKICRLGSPVLEQRAVTMLHALSVSTAASPRITSLFRAIDEAGREEPDSKRVKAASPTNQPK